MKLNGLNKAVNKIEHVKMNRLAPITERPPNESLKGTLTPQNNVNVKQEQDPTLLDMIEDIKQLHPSDQAKIIRKSASVEHALKETDQQEEPYMKKVGEFSKFL